MDKEAVPATVAPVLARIDADFDGAVDRLVAWLRIPSVSTDPAFAAEVRRAGQWIADDLAAIGFQAELCDTPGHPMVVAHTPGPPGYAGPHLLYYGHYDVQPADPLELWESPPFAPVIVDAERGKRVVARGAVDDKGQVMTWVEAFRAWTAVHGALPARITVLLEGEEESGSRSLPAFLAAHRDRLSADVCVVTDTCSWTVDIPAVTTMLRGMVYVEVTLHGPDRDLHSGMYGGAVANPNNVLARVIAALHDEAGNIRIPGFYDDVRELSAGQRSAWDALGFDGDDFARGVGLPKARGEFGRSALERLWSRPTADVNGMWGGYTGAGAKTVIPAHASAKISFRLVPDQDPQKILDGLRAFLDAHVPSDCRYELEASKGSRAIRVADESAYLRAAATGLAQVYGREPVLIGCGGSIPVVGMIQDHLGFDSILVGFGLEDDRVHSPNEKFDLVCLKNGIRSHAAILHHLASLAGHQAKA